MEGVMCKFSLFCFTGNCKDLLLHSDVLIPSDCPELPCLTVCKMRHHSIWNTNCKGNSTCNICTAIGLTGISTFHLSSGIRESFPYKRHYPTEGSFRHFLGYEISVLKSLTQVSSHGEHKNLNTVQTITCEINWPPQFFALDLPTIFSILQSLSFFTPLSFFPPQVIKTCLVCIPALFSALS